ELRQSPRNYCLIRLLCANLRAAPAAAALELPACGLYALPPPRPFPGKSQETQRQARKKPCRPFIKSLPPRPGATPNGRASTGAVQTIRALDARSLPLSRSCDPEDAHRRAIHGLRRLPPVKPRADDHKLAVRAFGLNCANPIGMGAGFDKSAEVPDALLRLGFGFVEIGTVTPKPQGGNPRPRLFRLERDEAVINRMGFNNDGAEVALRRLAARAQHGGIIGVNVGANKDSPDRVADYV